VTVTVRTGKLVATKQDIDRRSHLVADGGTGSPKLHIRESSPPKSMCARGAVLFVHGATLSSVLFDIQLPGRSWLDHCAQNGYRAFALDIRGYGGSEKPPAMSNSYSMRPPVASLGDAVEDIAMAVRFVREETGLEKIALIAGSWETVTCGAYAARGGDAQISKLTLYALLYAAVNEKWLDIVASPDDRGVFNRALGAYRLVTEQKLKERWVADLAAAGSKAGRDDDVFRAIFDSSIAADEDAPRHNPPAFRVPNGALLDLFSVFSGRTLYDAGSISTPTMLIRGSNDATSTRADALRLFDSLGSSDKRYVEISNAGHFASAERRAPDVFREVQIFLEAGRNKMPAPAVKKIGARRASSLRSRKLLR
jgi:pimeloyl-ACP methyl ester carboxylesterase